jgi:repressor LexA
MLTDKQQRVLDIVTKYIRQHGMSPTLEEIQTELGVKSKHSVVQFLEYLDGKGYISKGRGYRSIRLGERITASQLAIPIPIFGVANAGRPLAFAEERDEGTIMVSKNIVGNNEKKFFCVRVHGTSMNRFLIKGKPLSDGSVALIDSSFTTPDDPNAAYLCIVEGSATLKKVKRAGDSFYLVPESNDPVHSPIVLTHSDIFSVNGKVVDVFDFS